MKAKVQLKGIPAVRAGLRCLRSGEYVRPGDRFCYESEGRPYFYLMDGDALDLPDDDCELLASAGSRRLPFRRKIHPLGEGPVVLEIAPEPFAGFPESWLDADLHIQGPLRDEEPPPLMTAANMPVELTAEDVGLAYVVDGNGPLFERGRRRYVSQSKEYRSGAYGHYLFLGNAAPVEHGREQYLPDEPFPLPFDLLGAARRGGATIVCAHPITCGDFGATSSWPGGGYARGLPALLGAGLVDAVSITDASSDRPPARNCGITCSTSD